MNAAPAVQLIEKSKHIGFVLPSNPDYDVLACTEVIARFLISRAIYVGLVAPLDAVSFSRNTQLSSLASLCPLIKEFVVSLDTSKSPISQLRYENADNRIDVILSPASKAITQDYVAFRDGKVQCDCMITFGINDTKQIDAAVLGFDPSFFSETPVIALNNSGINNPHGEIILGDQQSSSLAELTYQFLAAFPNHTISRESATLLLSGILYHTQTFAALTNAAALRVSYELMDLGADYQAAQEFSRSPASFFLMPLIGRALARSKMDSQKQIVWSLLTSGDMLATQRSAQDIPDVLRSLIKEISYARAHILLWQQPTTQGIHVSLTVNAGYAELLRRSAGTKEEKGGYIELTEVYESFPEAERAVSSLLNDAV